jgi:hypothetical protein
MGFLGGRDREERYKEYLEEGSMFGKKDFEEWSKIEDQAEEIASGLVQGTFTRDEKIWKRVKEIKEKKQSG